MTARILTVAEFDLNGFSGVQADVKTAMALGGYAAAAASILVANTQGGIAISGKIEPSFIAAQMKAALDGVGVDAVKIGFLENTGSVNAVADVLDGLKDRKLPVVVDPSIVLRNGTVLTDEAAFGAWKHRLYTLATVLTPNLAEVMLLSGLKISNLDDMLFAADVMRSLGAENVVLKCGRTLGDQEQYVVATEGGTRVFERRSLDTVHTFGAGSTLSTALAVFLARGMDIFSALEAALDYLQRAIETPRNAGFPEGALNHGFAFNSRDGNGANGDI